MATNRRFFNLSGSDTFDEIINDSDSEVELANEHDSGKC